MENFFINKIQMNESKKQSEEIVQQILAIGNYAEQTRLKGNKVEAGKYFTLALQLIAEYEVPPELEAAILSNFGILLASEGYTTEAIEVQRKALSLDIKTGIQESIAISNHNLGKAYYQNKEYEKSIIHLEISLKIRQEIKDYYGQIDTYASLALSYLELKQLSNAKENIDFGIQLKSIVTKYSHMRHIYAAGAKVAQEMKDFQLAISFTDIVIMLLEQLRERNKHDVELDLFDSRYNEYYLDAIELFLECNEYEKALTIIDRTRCRSICDSLEGIKNHISTDKKYVVELPNISKDELYLVQWTYPKIGWIFPISSNQTNFIAKQVFTTSNKTNVSIKDEPSIKLDIEKECTKHFKILQESTQNSINEFKYEFDKSNIVYFIPHGAGWEVPYSTLKCPNSNELLINNHQIVICPSLRFARISQHIEKVKNNNNLVIGDTLDDLPHARKEAMQVSNLLNCRPIIGKHATKNMVRSLLENKEFNIIHFSTHGIYSGNGLNALQLADGILTAQDIFELNPKCNLLNLSSCWSGSYQFSKWNELHGLIRAFLISKTINIVASFYPLGDEACFAFNESFYSNLKDFEISSAFQKGILSVSNKYSEFEWGGLYFVGRS
jgi:CHAT domain-containing protein/Tfp pilus assembly protein PilF